MKYVYFYLVTKMYNCNNWLLSNQSKLYNFRQTKSVSNTEIKSQIDRYKKLKSDVIKLLIHIIQSYIHLVCSHAVL